MSFFLRFFRHLATSTAACLPCDHSAAHSAQWQDLELIFLLWLTRHGNRRARRGRIAFASLRPEEAFIETHGAACFQYSKVFTIHIQSPFPCHRKSVNSGKEKVSLINHKIVCDYLRTLFLCDLSQASC